jgi:deoxycytidine triphosphate deaminase
MGMINIAGETSNSILTNVQPSDPQPNAVDLRLKQVRRIVDGSIFIIDEESKTHRKSTLIEVGEDGYWHLESGSYEVVMENEIGVAHGEAGFVITRSTLNRNGVFITSGLYDSGYGFKDEEYTGGVMAGAMHVNGTMKIKPGTRVAQYICFTAETLHMYNGSYGNHKEHDQKYK